MDHHAARSSMTAAVEGQLDAAQEQELALHLVGCPECKSLYDRLQKALRSLAQVGTSHPPAEAVSSAITRATTVLRGQADPGPGGTSGGPAPVIATDAGPPMPVPATTAEPGPPVAPGDLDDAEPTGPPLGDDPVIERPHTEPLDLDAPLAPPTTPMPTHLPDPPGTAVPPSSAPPPTAPDPQPPEPAPGDAQPLGDEPTPTPASLFEREQQRPVFGADATPDASSTASDDRPDTEAESAERPARRRPGLGPWLAAIAAALILALLAGYLIARTQGGLFGEPEPEMPTADDVRGRLGRTFGDLASLKASFTIRKLSLYPLRRDDDSLFYSFSEGLTTGRIVFERGQGHRLEHTLEVQDQEIERVKVVRQGAEVRTLRGAGPSATLSVVQDAPLGPPDGELGASLGVLEDSLSAAVRFVLDAPEIEVRGFVQDGEEELLHVAATVPATTLSRADEIELFLDPTFFPTRIRRSLSKDNGAALGPSEVLADETLASLYGERDSIVTELVEFTAVNIGDVILPGDFVLDTPAGVEAEMTNAGFKRITRGQIPEDLPFRPMYPGSLPDDFEEVELALYDGEPRAWGPNDAYPAPDGVIHARYFDGKSTIVVTQRHLPDGAVELDGSPLAGQGLPVPERSVVRNEKRFFYASSPEVPPHAYGFLGNMFVMAVGYAPSDDLITIVASMAEAPAPLEADPDASPGAPASPGASPAPTATP